MKIAVAVSGGVDSGVAAALLAEQGHDVFGIIMQHYDNQDYGYDPDEGISYDITQAEAVCDRLGIKLHVIDLKLPFYEIIVKKFIDEYQKGRTPNPCTLCNPTIKFGLLLAAAVNLGATYMATGHYIKAINTGKEVEIYRGADKNKDQSYMLWALQQTQLAKIMFPLGDIDKSAVRELAKRYQLVNAQRQDSQEICFIKQHYRDLLEKHTLITSGDIVHVRDGIIGQHRGSILYTIGQRKGLDCPWKSALYVSKIDVNKNIVYVTDNSDDLLRDIFTIKDVNWLTDDFNITDLAVQVRYNMQAIPVTSLTPKDEYWEVKTGTAIRAISPGQSAVFYENNRLMGGGVIRS